MSKKVIDTFVFLDVPRYHDGKEILESKLTICPLCHDTKTVSIPLQTIKLSVDPEYRTECNKCKIWWHSYRI